MSNAEKKFEMCQEHQRADSFAVWQSDAMRGTCD